MVKTLKVLADMVDSRAYSTVLRAKDRLSPGLDHLVFASEEFTTASFEPCDATAFRISRNDFRHYTPAVLDTAAGTVAIVVQRHGHGPGEELIASWRCGDSMRLSKWGSTRNFRWPESSEPIVLVGDGTVISLAMAMHDRAEAEGRTVLSVLEVADQDAAAVRDLLPHTHVVPSDPAPGAALDRWFAENGDLLVFDPEATYFLAGHGQSIQRQRAHLRETHGLDRRRIKTQPYWATGKAGL